MRDEEQARWRPDGADLGDACHHPKHPGINLRWVLLHLIEETARHAGHADATRELVGSLQRRSKPPTGRW